MEDNRLAAHSAALRKLTKAPALADQVATDHRTAPIGWAPNPEYESLGR